LRRWAPAANATFSNNNHASLWSGTTASWIDLNPVGASRSAAKGCVGAQQVGSATFSSKNHAGLWNGTAASWVDLNRAGTTESVAKFIARLQQLGLSVIR
jgi:hypothetical protein